MRPLFALLLFCMSTAFSAESTSGREWATAISTQAKTDRKIIFRYIKEFQPTFQRSAYPDRVIITWRYESDSGLPNPSERLRMERLEDLLAPVTEENGLATLVLVSTGENLREWTYYTQSEERFFQALNRALAAESRFPIEIHTSKDVNWKTYGDFRKGVRE
jgi:hypothetical protein